MGKGIFILLTYESLQPPLPPKPIPKYFISRPDVIHATGIRRRHLLDPKPPVLLCATSLIDLFHNAVRGCRSAARFA
jgi:hypothetical protein